MFLGRKGILPTLVLVFTLIAIGSALFYSSEAVDNQKGEIGEVVLDLLDLENRLNNEAIYDKAYLKQSINGVVIEFAENGLNHNWNEEYPSLDKIKENFALHLNNKLKREYDIGFVFNSGITKLQMKGIKGYNYSTENYNIDTVNGRDFEFEFDYEFSLLSDSVEDLKDVVTLCRKDTACWNREATFYWEEDNNLFKVEVPSGVITDAFGEKGVIILDATVDFS